jgi:hypothetical protein
VAIIADADPQVTGAVRLASWIGLKLSAVDIGNMRLAMMGLLPNLAGLVVAFRAACAAGDDTSARTKSRRQRSVGTSS